VQPFSNSIQLGLMIAISSGLINVLASPTWGQVESSSQKGSANLSDSLPLKQVGQFATVITDVAIKETETGVEINLATPQTPQTFETSYGETLVIDVINSQLQGKESILQENPVPGIASVEVVQRYTNTVRVKIVGETELPKVEVRSSEDGIALTATTEATLAEEPDAPPEEEAETLQEEGDAEEIELVVTAEQADDYYVPEASVGTRTETPIQDIPQSIQVVPGQVIREQRTNTLIEALQNVPGVSQGTQSTRGLFNVFSIRGFNASDNILRNGVADPSFSILGYDPSWIEQIEVLRGPASVLFGTGSLGGTVNLVGKRPLDEPFYELGVSVGSFDYYRGTADLSGPLNPEGTVLGRLNVAVESNGTFVDFFNTQRYVVTPSLTWRINDRATLNFDAQYFRLDKPFDTGLPAKGTILPNPEGEIPRNRFLGDFESSDDSEAYRVGLDFDYQFSDNWQLRSVFNASFLRLDRLQYPTLELQPDNRTMTRAYAPQDFQDSLYNFDTYITGEFAAGSLRHQLVTGINLYRLDSSNVNNRGSAPTIDIFNPVYGQPLGPSNPVNDASSQIDVLGVYLQDQVALLDNLKLVLGGRFDIANFSRTDRLNETTASQQYESFSPRVGLVYQPIQPLSLYASFSRSFEVTASVFGANPTPEPEFGTQYEVGIKADISDRLATTLAFYNLTRTNVPTPDLENPGFSIFVGEQRSRGIDFSLTGEVLPGWNLIIGYALTDARITKDNRFDVGNSINNVPLHSFNLWSTYEIQDGLAEGLGFGLGLFYVGDRQGDLANTFEIPSYLRTDAAIFYDRENFRAALNFRNLFDVDYFESAVSINRVFPGAPFTVIGSLSWEF